MLAPAVAVLSCVLSFISHLLQYSHIGLHGLSACSPPVPLEAHHQRVGLHAAQTRGLEEKQEVIKKEESRHSEAVLLPGVMNRSLSRSSFVCSDSSNAALINYSF